MPGCLKIFSITVRTRTCRPRTGRPRTVRPRTVRLKYVDKNRQKGEKGEKMKEEAHFCWLYDTRGGMIHHSILFNWQNRELGTSNLGKIC